MKRGQDTVKRMLDFLWQDWHDGKSDGEVFLYWKDRYEQEFGKYVTPIATTVEQKSKYYSCLKQNSQKNSSNSA